MELSTSTWMLIFFGLFFIISIWKISAFLPNKPLQDDDTTPEAIQLLETIMLQTIISKRGELSEDELYVEMQKHAEFDSNLFWRFNLNKLRQLLKRYYAKNEDTTSIADIYEKTS